MNIYEAMKYINGFSKSGERVTDLSRFKMVMEKLGNPQEKLKIIHVAGTNGKGSTVRMLETVFIESGYNVGAFTSPFMVVYNDRIRFNGENITDDELSSIITQISPLIEDVCYGCSQFEISTAIAFLYFAVLKCDVVILEAGVGGLLDCTNIIKKPVMSVITSVSLDHTKILGSTIKDIAIQKAGIIKSGCPVVLALNQSKVTESVVRLRAKKLSSQYLRPDKKIRVVSCGVNGSVFKYRGLKYELSMLGKIQIENALTVISVVGYLMDEIFPKLTYKTLRKGLRDASLPLRCQKLGENPTVIIDGAHNPDAMKKLADYIRIFPNEPKVMVCGMVEDKDYTSSVGYISRYIDYAYCVDGFTANTVFAPKLVELFRDGEAVSMKNALSRAKSMAGKKGMVIIGGSLYMGTEFLDKN